MPTASLSHAPHNDLCLSCAAQHAALTLQNLCARCPKGLGADSWALKSLKMPVAAPSAAACKSRKAHSEHLSRSHGCTHIVACIPGLASAILVLYFLTPIIPPDWDQRSIINGTTNNGRRLRSGRLCVARHGAGGCAQCDADAVRVQLRGAALWHRDGRHHPRRQHARRRQPRLRTQIRYYCL